MPRYVQAPTMTPNQVLYVLECALAEKKLSTRDIQGYLSRLADEIRSLEARVELLRSGSEKSSGGVGRVAAKGPRLPIRRKASKKKPARKMTISPERLASMKLQGQYLALIAKVAKKDRPKFQKMAKEKGRDSAIAAMRKAL